MYPSILHVIIIPLAPRAKQSRPGGTLRTICRLADPAYQSGWGRMWDVVAGGSRPVISWTSETREGEIPAG